MGDIDREGGENMEHAMRIRSSGQSDVGLTCANIEIDESKLLVPVRLAPVLSNNTEIARQHFPSFKRVIEPNIA